MEFACAHCSKPFWKNGAQQQESKNAAFGGPFVRALADFVHATAAAVQQACANEWATLQASIDADAWKNVTGEQLTLLLRSLLFFHRENRESMV